MLWFGDGSGLGTGASVARAVMLERAPKVVVGQDIPRLEVLTGKLKAAAGVEQQAHAAGVSVQLVSD